MSFKHNVSAVFMSLTLSLDANSRLGAEFGYIFNSTHFENDFMQ